MTRIMLVLTALAIVFPATSSAAPRGTKCPQSNPYELIKVTNVSCGKAKSVLKDYFKDQVAPKNWTCKQKQYPGGATTTCRMSEEVIKHFSAD